MRQQDSHKQYFVVQHIAVQIFQQISLKNSVAGLKATPSFVYLYVNDLDSAGHSDGVGSDKWLAALTGIDSLLSAILMKLPRREHVIWLTSDHGMINVRREVNSWHR